MKYALFVSGGLGYSLLKLIYLKIDISFIATDSKSESIVSFALQNNIPLFKGNPRNGKLSEFSKSFDADIALSINYLFIIEQDTISLFKYAINFHGSLLPKYRGRTPHVWAIINGEKETGVTAHLIDSGCDTGDIVLQRKVTINVEDTGQSLLEKYVEIYPEMVQSIIHEVEHQTLMLKHQDHSLATYFDKRTPEDGQIDWNWQKERIFNWVRAQTYPYPGAFTLFGKEKIIIDRISYNNSGFDNKMPNGLILKSENEIVIVKTPNGAISIDRARSNLEILNPGDILESPNLKTPSSI
ncbi:methionyl-tRNA formyltransferase [Pseudopedobacter beijingensis]|uniref:Methionyl-tRNA formyltransferase n=1 Tax=Pseudopedobacter beijingensis TaxID=1207056 RepID=A0ABW4IBT2_9SPHI